MCNCRRRISAPIIIPETAHVHQAYFHAKTLHQQASSSMQSYQNQEHYACADKSVCFVSTSDSTCSALLCCMW
jgi:hypothetical protein